jgi:hypothetical protein
VAVGTLRDGYQRRSLWLIEGRSGTPFRKQGKTETSKPAATREPAKLVKCRICGVKVKATRLREHRRRVHGVGTGNALRTVQGGLPSLGKRR